MKGRKLMFIYWLYWRFVLDKCLSWINFLHDMKIQKLIWQEMLIHNYASPSFQYYAIRFYYSKKFVTINYYLDWIRISEIAKYMSWLHYMFITYLYTFHFLITGWFVFHLGSWLYETNLTDFFFLKLILQTEWNSTKCTFMIRLA